MNTSEALNWLENRPEITSLRAAVCDLNGLMRGKRVPINQAKKLLDGKMRLPLSAVCPDIWGRDVEDNPLVFEEGDSDGICTHTGTGFLPLGWTGSPSALLPMWMGWDDGRPYEGDPRRALEKVCQRYAALGLRPVVATELEFFLVDASEVWPRAPISPQTGRRLGHEGVLSLDQLDEFEAFFTDVYAACADYGIPADAAIAEAGGGQFEINLLHVDDPLEAADDALFFKRFVKGIARKHGMTATFMAKPFAGFSGNGFHVHFSLLDAEGNNVFNNGASDGSEMLHHAVGGILQHMAASSLIFAPHLNSFRRLEPNSHAPTEICWGYESRHAAVRIPGGPPEARRIEHRVAGGDTNPYLVVAAILGAALDGIERQTPPPPPKSGAVQGQGPNQLPGDWHSALVEFERSPDIGRLFSPELRARLVGMKRQEMRVFTDKMSRFEYETYLETV